MSSLTIRISLIPASISEDQFFALFQDFVNNIDHGPAKIILRSFAPSAASAVRDKDRVATATIENIPPLLHKGGVINLDSAGEAIPVLIDTAFLGLTPLYYPIGDVTVE